MKYHKVFTTIINPGVPIVVLQFGKECLTKLPEFITDSLYSVVFSLLAHPQLSIREHASKAFTSILSRSEFQVMTASCSSLITRHAIFFAV